jgi:hypothetical protein
MAIVDQLKEKQIRVPVKLFVLSLPIKKGSLKTEKPTVSDVIEKEASTLTETKIIHWVVIHYANKKLSKAAKKELDRLALLCWAKKDLIEVLRDQNGFETTTYPIYLQSLADNNNFNRLEEIVALIDQKITRPLLFGKSREKLLNTLFSISIRINQEPLKEKAIQTAIKVQKIRKKNKKVTRDLILSNLGFLFFDSKKPDLKKHSATQQVKAYEDADLKYISPISAQIRALQMANTAKGLRPEQARHCTRAEIVSKWVESAGEHGILPLVKTTRNSVIGVSISQQELEAFLSYIHSTTNNALLLAQVRATAQIVQKKYFPATFPEHQEPSISKYLARKDLTPAEKIYFFNQLTRMLSSRDYSLLPLRDSLWNALLSDEKLFKEYGAKIFKTYPQPKNKSQYPLYEQVVDKILKYSRIRSSVSKSILADLLFTLDRRAEAIALLSKNKQSKNFSEAFFVAYHANVSILTLSKEPLATQLAELSKLDKEMNKKEMRWEYSRRLQYERVGDSRVVAKKKAVADWLDRWWGNNKTSKIYYPFNKSLTTMFDQIIEDPEAVKLIEKKIETLSASNRMTPLIQASFAVEKLIYYYLPHPEKELGWIGSYLKNPETTDAERLYFVRRLVDHGLAYRYTFPEQEQLVKIILDHPELEATEGLSLIHVYPVPQTEPQRKLYSRLMDLLLERKSKGKKQRHGQNLVAIHLKTLHALGRDDEVTKLLNDSDLHLSQQLGAFMIAIDQERFDWCTAAFSKKLPFFFRRLAQTDQAYLAGHEKNLEIFYAQIKDPDTKLAAQIFFADPNPDTTPLKKLLAEFKAHTFTNVTFYVLAKDIFIEKKRLPYEQSVQPILAKWAADGGIKEIFDNAEKMTPLRWSVFRMYVSELFVSGRFEELTKIYKSINHETLTKADFRWICKAPFFTTFKMCEILKQGKRIPNPALYSKLNLKKYHDFLFLLDNTMREKKVRGSNECSKLNLAISLCNQPPKSFKNWYNRYIINKEMFFQLYMLHSTLLEKEPNQVKMQKQLVQFCKAIKKYNLNHNSYSFNKIGSHQWADEIIKTYPYNLNPQKWKSLVLKLLSTDLKPLKWEH